MAQARRHMAARPPTDEGEHGWEMLHRRRSLGAAVTLGIALLPLAHGLSQGPRAAPPSRETVQVISPAAARALARKTAATAVVDHRARTVTYTSAWAELVALGSSPGDPDETWNIAGMVNPTVHIHTGAQVSVHFFNADADQDTWHGWLLTTARPAYPRQVRSVSPWPSLTPSPGLSTAKRPTAGSGAPCASSPHEPAPTTTSARSQVMRRWACTVSWWSAKALAPQGL